MNNCLFFCSAYLYIKFAYISKCKWKSCELALLKYSYLSKIEFIFKAKVPNLKENDIYRQHYALYEKSCMEWISIKLVACYGHLLHAQFSCTINYKQLYLVYAMLVSSVYEFRVEHSNKYVRKHLFPCKISW